MKYYEFKIYDNGRLSAPSVAIRPSAVSLLVTPAAAFSAALIFVYFF